MDAKRWWVVDELQIWRLKVWAWKQCFVGTVSYAEYKRQKELTKKFGCQKICGWTADMEVESMGVKASLQRAWQIGQWTDVVLVGGDNTEVGLKAFKILETLNWDFDDKVEARQEYPNVDIFRWRHIGWCWRHTRPCLVRLKMLTVSMIILVKSLVRSNQSHLLTKVSEQLSM